jgi:phosphatidylglycerophosphate synthase
MTEQIDWSGGDRRQRRSQHRQPASARLLKIDALLVVFLVALGLIAAIALLRDTLPIDTATVGAAIAIYATIAMLAVSHLDTHPHARFGGANVITTSRAALTGLIGAIVLVSDGFRQPGNDALVWAAAAAAGLSLALDGVDGYIARRSGRASKFGARFDMEVDALLILFLSLAALVLGKAGAWVVLIGLMRYLFVAAQALVPALRGELGDCFRRKAICVVQGTALCLLMLPIVTPPLSTAIAAVALVLLAYSFGADASALLSADREKRRRP